MANFKDFLHKNSEFNVTTPENVIFQLSQFGGLSRKKNQPGSERKIRSLENSVLVDLLCIPSNEKHN